MAIAGSDDWFGVQRPKLLADGWIFYDERRYDPTILVGYTPTLVPQGIPNTAANRRKLNRPFFLTVERGMANPSAPWIGKLIVGVNSSLNPWVPGTVAPFGDETDWEQAVTGHYLANWVLNPIVEQELHSVYSDAYLTTTRLRAYAPAATAVIEYPGLWTVDPLFPNDIFKGSPNSLAAYNAMVDLFVNIVV